MNSGCDIGTGLLWYILSASLRWQSPRTSIGDFDKGWFTSGEAINLACQPNQAWCTPSVQNPPSIQEIAEDRGWETDNLPNEEITTELNQEELQQYKEAWQLTNDETDQIQDVNQEDDIATDFELGFAGEQISRMIEEILAFVQ